MKTGSITYNGKNSLELGVFTTGSGSFDAAELDVEKYEVPGRNGDVIIPKNRYKNIEVIYPAFIPKQFGDKVQSVRNWLRSAKVYSRLEDTYDTDHFRMGLASGVQSFEPANRNDGANFEMTFDCKPQRFLKVGETPETVEVEEKSASGEIVTFETIAESPMTSAEVSFSPVQDLNGYDSPWPGGGGKNKFEVTQTTQTVSGVTVTISSDGVISLSGTASAIVTLVLGYFTPEANTSYYVSGSPFATNACRLQFQEGSTTVANQYNNADALVENLNTTQHRIRLYIANGTNVNGVTIKPMIRLASEPDASFAPYSNICPISGHTGAELWDDPVYGGTIEWNQLANRNTANTGIVHGVSWSVTDNVITLSGTATETSYVTLFQNNLNLISGHKYLLCGNRQTTNYGTAWLYVVSNGVYNRDYGAGVIFNAGATQTGRNITIYVKSGVDVTGYKFAPQIFDLTEMFGATKADEIYAMEQSQTGSGVAYFKSLFPADYYPYNVGESTCVSAVNGGDYRNYSVTFPETIYGGSHEFVSGKAVSTHEIFNLKGFNANSIYQYTYGGKNGVFFAGAYAIQAMRDPGWCNVAPVYTDIASSAAHYMWFGANTAYVYWIGILDALGMTLDEFKTWIANNDVIITRRLASPVEYDLTPKEVTSLIGENNVWSDEGPITLTYAEPYTIENPTIFDARPLFTVTNPAEGDVIMVNGQAITFVDGYSGTVFIDCETMNAYSGAANLNSIIEATDFPVLVPGTNIITWTGTGVCTMTPRWWEL